MCSGYDRIGDTLRATRHLPLQGKIILPRHNSTERPVVAVQPYPRGQAQQIAQQRRDVDIVERCNFSAAIKRRA